MKVRESPARASSLALYLAVAVLVTHTTTAVAQPRRPFPSQRPPAGAPPMPGERPSEAGRPTPSGEVQWIDVSAPGGHTLVAAVARPRGSGPFPAVVVLHGSEGFRPHYVDLAGKLADAGFVALAGAWFSGSQSGTGRSFQDTIACPQCPPFRGATADALVYVSALIDAARKLPGVRPDHVGLFGHSAGAGMAVLAASSGTGVQAVAVSGAGYTGGPRGGAGLMSTARDLAAPLLILHDTADDQASVDGARQYERSLRDLGKTVEAQYFEGAPHQMTFRSETEGRIRERVIAFYRAYLGSGSAATARAEPGIATTPAPAAPAPAVALRAGAGGYSGPLFDAHAHMLREGVGAMAGRGGRGGPGGPGGRGPGGPPRLMAPGSGGPPGGAETSPSEIVDRLRAAGISGMFLFAAPPPVQQQYPDVVYAFVTAPPSPAGPVFDDQTPGRIEQGLRAGARGIGELSLRHKPTGNLHPADGPVPMRIYELAGRSQVPVTVHIEHEFSRELEHALSQNPKTTFIWAHAGSGPASTVGDLMRRYPNLYADLSTRNPITRMGIPLDQNSITDTSGRLKPEWKALFEEFPGHFMVGLDVNNTERMQQIDELVVYYRSVLGQLPAPVAEKLAYRNARRLLGLEP